MAVSSVLGIKIFQLGRIVFIYFLVVDLLRAHRKTATKKTFVSGFGIELNGIKLEWITESARF